MAYFTLLFPLPVSCEAFSPSSQLLLLSLQTTTESTDLASKQQPLWFRLRWNMHICIGETHCCCQHYNNTVSTSTAPTPLRTHPLSVPQQKHHGPFTPLTLGRGRDYKTMRADIFSNMFINWHPTPTSHLWYRNSIATKPALHRLCYNTFSMGSLVVGTLALSYTFPHPPSFVRPNTLKRKSSPHCCQGNPLTDSHPEETP